MPSESKRRGFTSNAERVFVDKRRLYIVVVVVVVVVEVVKIASIDQLNLTEAAFLSPKKKRYYCIHHLMLALTVDFTCVA